MAGWLATEQCHHFASYGTGARMWKTFCDTKLFFLWKCSHIALEKVHPLAKSPPHHRQSRRQHEWIISEVGSRPHISMRSHSERDPAKNSRHLCREFLHFWPNCKTADAACCRAGFGSFSFNYFPIAGKLNCFQLIFEKLLSSGTYTEKGAASHKIFNEKSWTGVSLSVERLMLGWTDGGRQGCETFSFKLVSADKKKVSWTAGCSLLTHWT